MLVSFALAISTAVLLVLAYPRFDLAFLAPVALAPLLVAMARERRGKWRFLMGWSAGVVYWAASCYWIQAVMADHGGMAGWASWLAYSAFSIAKGLHMAVFAWLAGRLIQSAWATISVPALWVAIECTHGSLGFAWLMLGNAGIDMSVPMRVAPWTGVWGISFLFALTATALALAVMRRPRIQLAPLVVLPLLYLLPALPDAEPGTETAVLVQPNVSETAAWTPDWVESVHNRLILLSRGTVREGATSLVVWPEIPAPMYYYESGTFRDRINQTARNLNSYLLLNVVPHTPAGAPLNSALLVSPEGRPLGRYDKMNLVPFGEFVPGIFKIIVDKVSTEAGDFAPGQRQEVLPAGRHRIGAFVCYESVFPGFVRNFAQEGADVLVNISNDGWYGKTAARYQHLEIARMRAAESRRWLLRATNDGITATIDPAGRVRQSLPSYTTVATRTGFSYISAVTFYSRFGDWFVWLCALGALAALVRTQLWRITSTSPS